MKTWIIIALVFSTCAVQVDGGFLKKVFKNVGKVAGSIVPPLLGIDKLEKQAELGIHSVESGITTFNDNIANNLTKLDTSVKNEKTEDKKLADSGTERARSAQDISNNAKEFVGGVINNFIKETAETNETAQDMMKTVSDNVNKVGNAGERVLDNVSEAVIPEATLTTQPFCCMMEKNVNCTQNMQGEMGRILDNIEYISGIMVAISFIAVGLICEYALHKIEYVSIFALEIYVLKSIRMVVFFAALLVVLSIILKILQISLFSTPNRLLFFLLFPILFAFSYHYNRFLLFIFQYVCIGSNYASLFIRYVLFIPYLALYYIAMYPFVLTYNCFVNRHNHPNRIGKVVTCIYCLPPAFCVSYFACINVVEKMLEAKNEKIQFPTGQEYLSIAWVYSLFLNFILLYIIALVLKLCYGANHQENVRAELSSNENFYNG